MKLEYYSTIKDGKMQRNTALQIANDVKNFEGKRVHITLEKLKSKRSTQQNRLYWLYVTILANEIGYDKNEMHELIKFKFLKREKVFEKTGELFEYLESTAKLSKSDFADFIFNFQKWSAETFDVILPDPGSNFEIDL